MLKKTLAIGLLCLPLVHLGAAEGAKPLIEKGNRLWSEHHFKQAEAAFKEAVVAAPDDPAGHARLGALYLTTNRAGEAIQELQQAIMLDAENPRLFMLMSVAYIHQARYAMADAMAREALRLDPEMKNAEKMREYIGARQNHMTARQADPAPGPK